MTLVTAKKTKSLLRMKRLESKELLRKRDKLNQQHLSSPQVGDYWHEMYNPILVVVGIHADAVTVCDKTKSDGPDCWTWDTSIIKRLSMKEFKKRLCYSCEKNRTFAHVLPEAHKWVRQHAIQELFGDSTRGKRI